MRLLVLTLAAVLTLIASAHGRTHTRNVGLWVKRGDTLTVVVWPTYQQPQRTVVYYPVLAAQPTCRPAVPQQTAERYQPSKYSPSR